MHQKKEEVTCSKHGITYIAEVVFIGSKKVIQPCIRCMDKNKETKHREDSELYAHKKQQVFHRNFNSSNIPRRYTERTFENFRIENSDMGAAIDTARKYLLKITSESNQGANLILSGLPGTGKTHIACAIGREFCNHGRVLFVTVSEVIRKIRTSYRQGSEKTEQDIIDFYSRVNLLIIDEIGIQKGTESEEHLLFEIINNRYSGFKSTILISNLNASELKDLIGERAFDRMKEGGGGSISFTWGSYRSKVSTDDALAGAKSSIDTSREYSGRSYR